MKTTYPVLDPQSPPASLPRAGCALAMMIKAPRPGASKTRLVPPLTHVEAAALSECFLRDTTANIDEATRTLPAEAPAAGVAVYTPVGMESAFDGLLPEGFCLVAQYEGTFGERLFRAVEDLLKLGYSAVCLIDSDSPTLPATALATAVTELAKPGDRMVLGPSEDGGYYLIGVKQAHRQLFEDIDWSTEKVDPQTRARAAEIGLETVLLPTWYDVDDAATLRLLCEELYTGSRDGIGFAAPRTRAFLDTQLSAPAGRERVWPES